MSSSLHCLHLHGPFAHATFQPRGPDDVSDLRRQAVDEVCQHGLLFGDVLGFCGFSAFSCGLRQVGAFPAMRFPSSCRVTILFVVEVEATCHKACLSVQGLEDRFLRRALLASSDLEMRSDDDQVTKANWKTPSELHVQALMSMHLMNSSLQLKMDSSVAGCHVRFASCRQ